MRTTFFVGSYCGDAPLQTIIQPESGCCLHLHHHIANLKSDHFVNAAGNHPKTSQLQTFWWFLGWFPSHTTNSCWHGEYQIPGKKHLAGYMIYFTTGSNKLKYYMKIIKYLTKVDPVEVIVSSWSAKPHRGYNASAPQQMDTCKRCSLCGQERGSNQP